MARGRQTELAILGALSVAPMTGYAVREEIRQVLGHFWSESYGQIYPTLAELQRNGLIEAQQGTRPGSSTYTLTPAVSPEKGTIKSHSVIRVVPRGPGDT